MRSEYLSGTEEGPAVVSEDTLETFLLKPLDTDRYPLAPLTLTSRNAEFAGDAASERIALTELEEGVLDIFTSPQVAWC